MRGPAANGSDRPARTLNTPVPVTGPRPDNPRADLYAIAKLTWLGARQTPHEAALLAFSLAARACLFAPSSCFGARAIKKLMPPPYGNT